MNFANKVKLLLNSISNMENESIDENVDILRLDLSNNPNGYRILFGELITNSDDESKRKRILGSINHLTKLINAKIEYIIMHENIRTYIKNIPDSSEVFYILSNIEMKNFRESGIFYDPYGSETIIPNADQLIIPTIRFEGSPKDRS